MRCRDHRTVGFRIILSLQRKRGKLVRKRPINELAIRGKVEKLKISLQYRYSAITENETLGLQAINDILNYIIRERAVKVGAGQLGRIPASSFMR